MNDTQGRPHRVTLTAIQAANGIGRILCERANNILADGKVTEAEALELLKWIDECGEQDVPAIAFVREEIRRFASDGVIYPWELGRLQLALERILPPR